MAVGACGRSTLPTCGDGIVDANEECDDGNRLDGDGCNRHCRKELCGNGIRDENEECDDGNNLPGDGCDPLCREESPPSCGNGVVDSEIEECDDGNREDGDGCSRLCRLEAPETCGNGSLDVGEQCDDGNRTAGDGCDERCRIEVSPTCGDGTVDVPLEECDDGNRADGDGCDRFCRVEPPGVCGDGRVDEGEECDDANLVDGDGCDANCRREPPPSCGNGTLEVGEDCDDGNRADGDGCDRFCRLEPCKPDVVLGTLPAGEPVYQKEDLTGLSDDQASCGRGPDLVVSFELATVADLLLDVAADSPQAFGLYHNTGTPSCTSSLVRCFLASAVGSTVFKGLTAGSYYLVIEPQVGSVPAPLLYALTVQAYFPECGNGLVDPGELCDDGNSISGDGCSADCRSNETCGNLYLDVAVGEVCDDGNKVSGDGCSADCRSNERCGNGIVDIAAGEVCDDGNRVSGDGCSADCRSSELCGNRVVDYAIGEVCDDGNRISGDGCSADCLSKEVCGNGILDTVAGEVCDDGNKVSGDGCSADCKSKEVCGNGIVDKVLGEVCDDGNTKSGDGCSFDCKSNETCGNGILDTAAGEQCDDGNKIPGDGCDASCKVEPGSCKVDEELGMLMPGAVLERSFDVRKAGNNWVTDCGGQGPEYVMGFSLAYASDIYLYATQGSTSTHTVGLYKEGQLTETCTAKNGVCISRSTGSAFSVGFMNRAAGQYYLIVEGNSEASSGSVWMTLNLSGCIPSQDLGVLSTSGTSVSVSTAAGTTVYNASCAASTSGREVVLAFTTSAESNVELTWEQTGDHVFGLFQAGGGQCDDRPKGCIDPVASPKGTAQFTRVAAGSYVLIVDAHHPGGEGAVSLTLRVTGP